MVKKKGIVWNYFNKKIHGTQITAYCKFCNQSYIQNATRMERHIERCPKCPQTIKNDFIKLLRNKRAKSEITLKLAESWSKQQDQNAESPQNEKTEHVKNWDYEILRNQDADSNADEIDIVDSKSWHQNPEMQTVEPDKPTRNEEPKPVEANKTVPADAAEEEASKVERPVFTRRILIHPKRISHLPLQSNHKTTNSFFINKIQHEQYLERLAMRKIAELELQRKTLEFEKITWEHTVEKTRNEMRWAHECRMMQLKEEHQQQLIEQARDKLLVYTS